MQRILGYLAAAAGLAAVLAAGPVMAGDVRMLPDQVFSVTLTDAAGSARDVFTPDSEVVFNIRFGLMMSEVSSYPVTATIIIGPEGSRQKVIESFSGRLDEGFWMLTEAVRVEGRWSPEVPYKVLLKTRIFSRSGAGSNSFYAYYKDQGVLKIGY